MIPDQINLDIEVTNRCNADCYFCPRDQTPHQGLMSSETFEMTLERAVEFRAHLAERTDMKMNISLCGLGEPLLNPRAIDFIAKVREAGFECSFASNGSLLSEEKGQRMIDAGLNEININVGEEGEDYERIYGLPFEKTRANVVRFAKMAKGRCHVNVVLVDHRQDPAHTDHMRKFWRDQGIDDFFPFPLMNRGGALVVDHMRYDDTTLLQRAKALIDQEVDAPVCIAPIMFLFVGYDGRYYLCCADWKKEAAYGTVADRSLIDVMGPKLAATRTRELVCHSCSSDPTNTLVDALREFDSGEIGPGKLARRVETVVDNTRSLEALVDKLAPGTSSDPAHQARRARKLIPIVNS